MKKKVAPRDRVAEVDEATRKAEAYVPSEDAMVLARIFDGEARTPWQAVPDDSPENDPRERVTEYDLRRGEEILGLLLRAFRAGDRDVLSRVEDAIIALTGEPRTATERQAWYVAAVERYGARLRSDRWLFEHPSLILDIFGRYAHPNFLSLDPWELRDALTVDKPALTIATELAIHVEAFDSADDPEPGSAAQLDRVKDRLKKASKRVK